MGTSHLIGLLLGTEEDWPSVFEALMQACKVCTLGQLSNALYDVGGQYRRNM